MSWQYYINMEPLALEIADAHINKMTNENTDKRESCFLDEKKFIPNLKNGFVAITMLVVYIESFTNSLVRLNFGEYADDFYRKSTKEKLQLLYLSNGIGKDIYEKMNGSTEFKQYNDVSKVRNEMIHYKVSVKEHASRLADFKISQMDASKVFSKSWLQRNEEGIKKLVKIIAGDLGYGIKDDIPIVSSDGMDPIYNYVYKPYD